MNPLLPSIILTGFGVAFFFHAAIPTHWLPFVLAGRGQRWSHGKTLAIVFLVLLAGLGHILFTTALGILVVWGGIETSRLTGDVFPFLAGGVLIVFGLYYLYRRCAAWADIATCLAIATAENTTIMGTWRVHTQNQTLQSS